jgi:hypothetical protein
VPGRRHVARRVRPRPGERPPAGPSWRLWPDPLRSVQADQSTGSGHNLHAEIKTHTKHLKALTRAAAPELLDAFGVGVDIAAQMLITAGDNADRVRQRDSIRQDVRRRADPHGIRQDERSTSTQPGWE